MATAGDLEVPRLQGQNTPSKNHDHPPILDLFNHVQPSACTSCSLFPSAPIEGRLEHSVTSEGDGAPGTWLELIPRRPSSQLEILHNSQSLI